jgi:hypothetical protein
LSSSPPALISRDHQKKEKEDKCGKRVSLASKCFAEVEAATAIDDSTMLVRFARVALLRTNSGR